jgi:hypothetical protein
VLTTPSSGAGSVNLDDSCNKALITTLINIQNDTIHPGLNTLKYVSLQINFSLEKGRWKLACPLDGVE